MLKIESYELKATKFPDKTSQIMKFPAIAARSEVTIDWNFESEDEFIHLAQVKTYLDSLGVKTSLNIPFLPYGRQDKEIKAGNTYALHTFAALLNSLNFQKVTSYDVHNLKVTASIIKNFSNICPLKDFSSYITSDCLVFFPDKGAYLRYFPNISQLVTSEFSVGEKVRNQETGKITHYAIENVENIKYRVVWVLDDLCDGGATFVLAANALHNAGALKVNLFVSHGLFTKGLDPLIKAGFKNIASKTGFHLSSKGAF